MTGTVGARPTDDAESIDDVLRAIGHEYGRLVLYYLRDHDGMATEDELVRHLVAESDLDADIGSIKLQHDVLPQLDATGAISYDTTSGLILYNGGSLTTELLERIGRREHVR